MADKVKVNPEILESACRSIIELQNNICGPNLQALAKSVEEDGVNAASEQFIAYASKFNETENHWVDALNNFQACARDTVEGFVEAFSRLSKQISMEAKQVDSEATKFKVMV